jgi:polyhydroxyalkanoic acid synthase PhaR subunit
MSKQPEPMSPFDPFDPFGAWRTTRDTYVEAWSKAMIDLVSTEAFSDAMGRSLDAYLTMSAPVRRVLETTMEQVLAQLNMPSRAEVVSLAERLTNIEMRLDDLDARFDALHDNLKRSASLPEAPAPATSDAPSRRRTRNGA